MPDASTLRAAPRRAEPGVSVSYDATAAVGDQSRPWSFRKKLLLSGLLLAALTLALNPGLVRDVRDQFIPKRWGVVEPGKIYRSGQISARLIGPMLKEYKIKRVVDLTRNVPDPYHDAELAAIAELDIDRRLCPLLSDGTGNLVIYADAVAAVAEAARDDLPVLVHCYAGTQRTGGVLAFYQLLVKQKPPGEVLAEMRQYQYDPDYSPKLLAYLNANMEGMARALVERGVIESVPQPLPVIVAD